MRLYISFAAFLIATPISAQTWSTYDWQSGNNYTSTITPQGTHTDGFNLNTGSMWQLDQNHDGTYSGIDGSGNFFSGDNNTGSYINSDGTACIGTGDLRTCF